MIANRPAIDWLTLTTFSAKTAFQMDRIITKLSGNQEPVNSKYLMYEGKQIEGIFAGEGTQKGKRHFLFRLSGDNADEMMFGQPLRPSLECSRIDVQITLPIDASIDTYKLFRSAQRKIGKGEKKRKVNAILNQDGFCTIYVGNRQSEKLYRIYVKELSGERFIRFEIEYKGKNGLAGRVYREISKEPTKTTAILAGELSTLADHKLTRMFRKHLAHVEGDIMPYERRITDPNTTLIWIAKQVMPAFKRMLGNEDTRHSAFMLLEDLNNFANGVGIAVDNGHLE